MGPDTDLRLAIEEMVEHYGILAGALMSATGVLSRVELALSGDDSYSAEGSFVISSCTGTAGLDKVNLLLSVKGQDGETLSGVMLQGCIVADSVELVLGAIERAETN